MNADDGTTSLPANIVKILGIEFFYGTAAAAAREMTRRCGFLIAPSAPGMVRLRYDESYRTAATHADLAIADSGLMALVWRLVGGGKVDRISGLNYLQQLFKLPELRAPGALFCVLPHEASKEKALAWFAKNGFQIGPDDCYLAPIYDAIVRDERLVEIVNQRKPAHVLVCVGSGPQEKLGYYLRERSAERSAIHCIGGALGFITGDQIPIPTWADRLYLGWLLRLLAQPRLFFPRAIMALELPGLIFRYREQLPPLVRR